MAQSAPVSRYQSTAAERHAFQEKKRKEEIQAAKCVVVVNTLKYQGV